MRNKSIIGFGAILFLLVVLLVSAAISYVTIYDPADLSASGWINGTNDTIDFRFNWTGGPIALANCTLYIDDDNYGNESNVLENVTTTILANKTLDNGTHTWYVNCSNNDGSMSSSENIIGIDNLAPISSTDAPSEWKSVSSIIVNFTSDNDDLSPITNYSCQGVGCTPTAANSQTINSEGNNTVKYFSGDDARNNETPIKTAYVLLDTSNPTMNLSNPIDSYTYLDQNNFNFTFNVTDAYSNTLDCDLIINGVLNETNSTVQNDTKTEFVNKFLADGNYNWNISCEDLAGNNNTSETKSFTVDVTPDKPVIFTPINLTSDTRINIYGYVNRSGLNTNVTVYAQQEASQYINSTLTTETSSKTGTATINESQIAGNGFFYINKEGSLPAGFGVGNFTEFSNHQPPNWERYEIIDTTEFADRYQINITPSLREDINTSDSVSAYNQSKPTGWFNVSVPLFSGNNTIQVDAKRLENYGPVSDSFNTFSDITAPTINLSLVTNYTINNAKINFSISDDYVLNVSTVVANISGTIYNSTNVSCSGTATQQECSLNANLTNSYHNITVSINDVIGNSNTSEKKQFLVNSQTPIVSLELLADNYEEDDNNNITLSFNVTDIFDQSLNCSIYINTILNNTNETVQNGTSTGVQLDNLTDGEYNWDVSCENDLGLTNTSETRTFTISNTPEKAGIWLYESLIDTNIANIIGVIGKNNTLVNATIEQGELIPYNNYTTSTQDSELNLITTTLKQQASQGEYCVYVNKTLNESFIPGRWIEFVNHNKSNAYFERYNITNRTNDWGEGENAFYTRVCMQENLTATVPTTTSISVYDTNYPKGWFNITLSLREGENNITLEGSRLGLIGQDSDLITIFYDNSAPTINLSTIPGNLTTNTPTITFVLEDDYNVSLPTLLLNISNSTNSTMHVWDQETAHNISSWEMGANISCSGNRYLQTCSLTQSLSDDTYNLSFTINDTINHQITDNKAIIIAATISGSSEINDTGATTDNRFMLNVSWTNTTSEQYFDHYELAVGTETYPNNGYDNEETWFAVGNNVSYEITNLTLVPGEMYYVHLKSVNTFGVNSTVVSTDGIAIEDNSVPVYQNGSAQWTGTDVSNIWTNEESTLRGLWNFIDNETNISKFKFTIGTTKYPVPGYDDVLSEKEILTYGFNETGLNLTENTTYYFSVKAKNGYQYGWGWSDWYSSEGYIKQDISNPTGGSISYQHGNYTSGSITITYLTGDDSLSGYNRSELLKKETDYDANNGGCGAYSDYSIINATILKVDTLTNYYYNGLEDGKCYKFALRVYDKSGNYEIYVSGNEDYNVTSDSTAPSTITITDEGTITGSRNVSFSWTTASDSDTGIDHYEYALGTSQGSESIISYTNNGLTQSVSLTNQPLEDEQTYYLTIKAYNRLGLYSTSYSDGILYLDMDTPAKLNVLSVSNDTAEQYYDFEEHENTTINLTGEEGLTCAWSWYDIDYTQPDGLTNYSWSCTNTANDATSRTGNYTCLITNVAEGLQTVHVNCKDDAGNKQSSSENTDVTFTKERTAPNINITYPENNSIVNGIVDISATIWDVSNYTANYELRKVLDNSLIETNSITNASHIPINTTSLEGEYKFIIFAIDDYNHSNNSSINIIVDNNAPTTNIILTDSYYNADFNFTISATLLENVSYNITNSVGILVANYSNTSSSMRNTLEWKTSVNVSALTEGTYTITAIATDNESNSRTDSENFTIDKTDPEHPDNSAIEPSGTIFENETITLYLNWKELNLDAIWIEHNANGSNVNYTAIATTPGENIYENATRYKVDIATYMTESNETITYSWHARDLAGNENSTASDTIIITNREPEITTTNLTDAWQDVVYQELIHFEDMDEHSISDFNCSIEQSGLTGTINTTIQSSTVCLLQWDIPGPVGNHSVNITVTDGFNTTKETFNLSVLPTAIQNTTMDSSHTMNFNYWSDDELQYTTTASTEMNVTLPTSELYTISFEVDNLIVITNNYNITNNMELYFQLLNNNTIDDNNSDIGASRTYKPLEAYAFSINSTHNETYRVEFNYSEYGVLETNRLKIYKFAYDENNEEINYSDSTNVSTTVNISSMIVYTTVSNFSTFVLTYNTGETEQGNDEEGGGGSGSGSSGSGSSGSGDSAYYSGAETCEDGVLNQDEIGIDCGGSCNTCETCHDLIQNQGETGVDCGGPCSQCMPATCTDGKENDDEEGVDCGGPCAACEPTPTCTDGIKNNLEEGIDCGGACIPCSGCDNGIRDEGEEDVDCGGICENNCPDYENPIEIRKTPAYVWLIVIAIIISGGVSTLWIYRKEEGIVKQVKAKAVAEEREIGELKEEEKNVMTRYIMNYLNRGLGEQSIKSQLLMDGFKERHVNPVLMTVLRIQKVQEIRTYIDTYSKQGYSTDQLKNWILEQGTEEDLVEEAMNKFHSNE